MTDWPVLDVALGLTLVYTSASLLCSSLNEAIASLLGRRARFLEKWLRNALSDPDGKADVEAALHSFYQHPLIQPLLRRALLPRFRRPSAPHSSDAPDAARTGGADSSGGGLAPKTRRPSYLPASTFVSALLNLNPDEATGKRSLDEIVKSLPPSHAKRAVVAILQEVGHDEAALRKRLETWYDQSMERVSGWYKRRAQVWLAVIGLVAACLLNIDSVQIADTLWSQPNVRSAVVASASKVCCTATTTPSTTSISDTVNYLNSLNAIKLPIGWDFTKKHDPLAKADPRHFPHGLKAWLAKIIGILITTLALLLGAPFWFQLLGRLVSLKGSGPTPKLADATPAPGSAGQGG